MDNCKSMHKQAAELWEAAGPLLTAGVAASGPQGAVVAAAVQIGEKLGHAWNKLAGNSPLKIGARYLTPNDREQGTVVLGTERMFIGGPLPVDSKVVFRKVDGDAEATVSVCTFDNKGVHKDREHFKLDRSTPDGRTFTASIPRGHVVTVLVDSQSTLKKLQYTVALNID